MYTSMNAIIAIMITFYGYHHKIYNPSSGDYNFVCAGLIETWPILKDEDVNPEEESDVHYVSG